VGRSFGAGAGLAGAVIESGKCTLRKVVSRCLTCAKSAQSCETYFRTKHVHEPFNVAVQSRQLCHDQHAHFYLSLRLVGQAMSLGDTFGGLDIRGILPYAVHQRRASARDVLILKELAISRRSSCISKELNYRLHEFQLLASVQQVIDNEVELLGDLTGDKQRVHDALEARRLTLRHGCRCAVQYAHFLFAGFSHCQPTPTTLVLLPWRTLIVSVSTAMFLEHRRQTQ
jgi:hypothetical protein